MSIKVHQFGGKVVADLTLNKEGTRMAVAIGSNVEIHAFNGKTWSLEHTLTDHQLYVSGVDWDHNHNRIVSVSHDRNAFVWTYDEKEALWKPSLVVVRCTRSLLRVKWSPKGNKFAIGSADKTITVCYYDKSNDWWVTKKCKDSITSSVSCLDWNANNMHVVCGTTSNQVLLYMCWVKETEAKPKPDKEAGDKIKFKKPFSTIWEGDRTIGQVKDVKFVIRSGKCSDASFLACDSASALYYYDTSEGTTPLWTHLVKHLPFSRMEVLTDSVFCVGGFGNEPILYTYDNGKCKEKKQIDPKKKTAKKQKSKVQDAMNIFKRMDDLGQKGELDVGLKTKHQNTISAIVVAGERDVGKPGLGSAKTIMTSGNDGRVITWPVESHI